MNQEWHSGEIAQQPLQWIPVSAIHYKNNKVSKRHMRDAKPEHLLLISAEHGNHSDIIPKMVQGHKSYWTCLDMLQQHSV